ncbi:MAG: L-serine ammonia-lyase [Casimicrobiaceae bacterium]
MVASAFDLFRIGPGPSSMHVMGPHRAANRFVQEIATDGILAKVHRVEVELFGGLAFTGRDLGTDRAIIAGLTGLLPDRCDHATLARYADRIETEQLLKLANGPSINFAALRDLRFVVDRAVAYDGNAMRFVVSDRYGAVLASRVYFSTGHGRIVGENDRPAAATIRLPYRFVSADALLEGCSSRRMRVADFARANECIRRSPDEVRVGLLEVAMVMRVALQRGLTTEGVLPSGNRRTAPSWSAAIREIAAAEAGHEVLAERAALYATAVAEEKAAGGRVVSAPSSGSAGPVAALLQLWFDSAPLKHDDGVVDFLLVSTTIGGMLRAAGVAHVGCQSEVGVAAAMAAAGFASALGASDTQIVYAADMALRPHLGLTCDPTAGRIEDPCIERNAVAASRACVAALAAVRTPSPRNGIDATIRAMVASGQTMASRHKSKSLAGVAVNLAEC